MIDGGLPGLFKTHLPEAHVQRIETGGVGLGIPDINLCLQGFENWVECKFTRANKVEISPEQVGWAERRIRAGGRVFLAVRKTAEAGPRRRACDELWIANGALTRWVAIEGLDALNGFNASCHIGGPASWDWDAVKNILTDPLFFFNK